MLILYYLRWTGTPEELKQYMGRVTAISDEVDGAALKGVFVPSSEWNVALLMEATSFDKGIEVYRTYMKQYGSHPKIPLAKLELLYTFGELGYPQ